MALISRGLEGGGGYMQSSLQCYQRNGSKTKIDSKKGDVCPRKSKRVSILDGRYFLFSLTKMPLYSTFWCNYQVSLDTFSLTSCKLGYSVTAFEYYLYMLIYFEVEKSMLPQNPAFERVKWTEWAVKHNWSCFNLRPQLGDDISCEITTIVPNNYLCIQVCF